MINNLKIILGTITILCGVLQIFEKWNSPDYIIAESSKSFPEWLSWFTLILIVVSSIGYFIVDYMDRKSDKRSDKCVN